ncbi:MAG: GMC family oxidoreductase [Methylophilaceae bacterium]
MTKKNLKLTDEWDLIVIGTGMGGATVGHTLALKGFSVLFLEKGREVASNEGWTDEPDPEKRLQQGWWPNIISQQRKGEQFDQRYLAVGCGRGGSAMHYAAALERLDPADFDALKINHQHVELWPISFKEFLPYYKKAEALYGITKNRENGRPKLSEWDQSFIQTMQKNGFNPERLNVAINYDKNCIECIGKVCHRKCKADAKLVCLDEALKQPNCDILDHCEVQTIDADATKVNSISAVHMGKHIKLRAKKVILAAGAMHSPQLLLKSKNAFWPNGLANTSDQVGRNLMFHVGDMYAVWSPKKLSRVSLQKKSISIRDFYVDKGQHLGHIQSLGLSAGRGHISMFIKDVLRSYGVRNKFLLSAITKIPATLASFILGEAVLFGINIEDAPCPKNRVILNPSEPNGTSFSYEITDDIQKRSDELYKQFSKAVKPWRTLRIMPTIEINHGHSCGTCRFGSNPENSVLDVNCRSHDIENLYVVDASFMPRSGAANPSLTIAANALRVAEKISDSLLTDKTI